MLQAQAKTREMIFFDNSYPFETCVVVLRCVAFWMLSRRDDGTAWLACDGTSGAGQPLRE
jgi:hypothetical protein